MITELLTFLSSGKIVDSAGESLKPARNKFMKHSRIGSISAFSSNSIFYFPIVVSDQLMPDEVTMTSRMIERAYASFVVACISLIPVHKISSDDANSIIEYLGRFHQNIGTGGNIKHNLQQNMMSYGLNKLTESVDSEDPDIRAAQEFILECWENSKKNDSDFVKLIVETVSVNDLFNEDAVDPRTRGIQKQFLAKRAELDTWGFIGEATDDMFDAADYEDMIDHLEDSEAEEDYEYDPDSEDELDDDDFDDSLLEAFSFSKLKNGFSENTSVNKEDPRLRKFKELAETAKVSFIPFDFKKAYTEWHYTIVSATKEGAEQCAKSAYAFGKAYSGTGPKKFMMCKFSDVIREYKLDAKVCNTYDPTDYLIACDLDGFGDALLPADIKATIGARYFTDIVDNCVRRTMDAHSNYTPKDYVRMENIDAARRFIQNSPSSKEVDDTFLAGQNETSDTMLISEAALPAATRKKLKDSDFGLPKERKYPLHDARHVKLAVKMFGHCPEGQQKQLAAAILKAAKKQGVEIKVSKKNPMSKYVPATMTEAVVMKKDTSTQESKVFSQTIATLDTISNNKIMSATSLTTLSAMEGKLKKLKTKYTKCLNRYKKQYEKTTKNDKVKLKIQFEKQLISDPKAFMKEYGKYIKIINQKLKMIEKRRAELRKQKGLSESTGAVNVATTLSALDLEAVDYCDRIITEALEAPDSDVFEYEEVEDSEDDPDDIDFDFDDTLGTDPQLTEAVNYQRDKNGNVRGKDISLPFEKTMFTENDAKRSNDAVPLFTKATISMETETGAIINQDLLIGIKGYIHRAPTADLIDDVYNCIINKRKFLRFVKFITGEEKSLADLLFGIKELKTDALSGENARWKATFKRRKRWSKMSIPYLMKEYTPNGTVVMTMNEVNFIKDQYGIDIMNMDHVRMIMDTDFLLGFVIVDQSEEVVYVRYDGHDYGFQTYTYAMLDREAAASDRMIREMYRAMSR